ncbi:hypothetical protein [Methanobacterium sp.]|uniref:hypothetical protein n=1 Tax=Methanobacterium sp. TaxID=2164 RepID=UPI003C748453
MVAKVSYSTHSSSNHSSSNHSYSITCTTSSTHGCGTCGSKCGIKTSYTETKNILKYLIFS